jgi:hypothetical protein
VPLQMHQLMATCTAIQIQSVVVCISKPCPYDKLPAKMEKTWPAWAAFFERQEERAGPSLVKRTALHYRCAACFYLVSRIRLISVYYMDSAA